MDWLERVAEIRKICNVPVPARNVAIARVWVDETFLELFAFSGKLLREGAVGLPNQPMFQTFDIAGHRRDFFEYGCFHQSDVGRKLVHRQQPATTEGILGGHSLHGDI